MAAEVGLVLALTQVETVGLWVGLVSAIVSIVLSIVAIGFARDVDRRSLEILRTLSDGRRLTRPQYQQLRQDPEMALALEELRDTDLLMPFQRKGRNGDETIYGLAPWFQDVIGPALVFSGHETPSAPEAERVAAALGDAGRPEVRAAAVSG